VDPVKKNSIFPGKFQRNFDFFSQFHKKIDFSRHIFAKISIFSGKFSKNFDFYVIFNKLSIIQANIAHLQLLLGKLFYFSSKVITFEHTSCT